MIATLCLLSAETANAQNFMPAADLLPQSTAGFVRIPDLPVFIESCKKMHIGELVDDPVMKPFMDAQKERLENYLGSVDNQV